MGEKRKKEGKKKKTQHQKLDCAIKDKATENKVTILLFHKNLLIW